MIQPHDIDLIASLSQIPSVSGDEVAIRDYLIEYLKKSQLTKELTLFYGKGFQDTLAVQKGEPKILVMAHMDKIGFTTAYDNKLITVGYPELIHGTPLLGIENGQALEAILVTDETEDLLCLDLQKPVSRGTNFIFKARLESEEGILRGPYLDNCLGIFSALKILESCNNVLVAFSTYEEHHGGTAGMLALWAYQKFGIESVIVADVTWATKGVFMGKGTAISMRDTSIPRRAFLNQVIAKAKASKVEFQLEVESAGGSDGKEIQRLPYPIDWVFIGPPSKYCHTPKEEVNIQDLESNIKLISHLVENLSND